MLESVCGRTGWLCHAYVLMGNHDQMGARSTVSREVGALEKDLPKDKKRMRRYQPMVAADV